VTVRANGISLYHKSNLHITDRKAELQEKNPFEVVYGFNPITPIELTPLPVEK
jgi:hypothetical protein